MTGLMVLGVFLILWGIATLYIAFRKPQKIWAMGKIQGFAKLLGDTGAAILFSILGAVAVGVGICLLIAGFA